MNLFAASVNQLLASQFSYAARSAAPAPVQPLPSRDTAAGAHSATPGVRGAATAADEVRFSAAALALPGRIPARPTSLSDLQRPKPQLNPSEEAALFDAESIEGGMAQQHYFDGEGAHDENGEAVEVEILSPELASRQMLRLVDRQQAAVSQLYSRNNDIVYHSQPMLALAA